MKRKISLDLQKWQKNPKRKPLIIKGARQIGKTYILQDFGQKFFKQFHYVNFEEKPGLKKYFEQDLDPQRILQELSFELSLSIDIENDLLIFDEIQECPKALTSLKYFAEKLPKLALCCAGSLLGLSLNETSFPVGKVDHLEMYPLNFFEFLDAMHEEELLKLLTNISNQTLPEAAHKKLWELMKIYMIIGGLPEVLQNYISMKDTPYEAFIQVRKKQKEIIREYIADMSKHSGKENAMHLQKLWSNIPQQLSTTHNGSSAKFKFSEVIPSKNRYSRLESTIDWLEAVGLIIKVLLIDKPNLPLKAFAQKEAFKLFIFDIGILGAMIDLEPASILAYDYGTYKGFMAENFVAQELLSVLGSYKPFFAWKENRNELEFLMDFSGKLYPVEVKSGWVVKSQSLAIFREKYKPELSSILSAQNLRVNSQIKINKYPLYLASRFPELVEKPNF